SGYLQKAQEYLDEGRYSRARSYAERALDVEENEAASEMLARIGREESEAEAKERAEEKAREEARLEAEREEAARRQAEEEARRKQEAEELKARELERSLRERERREAREAKEKKRVDSLLSKARKYLYDEEYDQARKYSYMAREISPDNAEAAEIITMINKAEMFGATREIMRESSSRFDAAKEPAGGPDPYSRSDEKNWFQELLGLGKEKKDIELGGRYVKDKVYTMDECVQIALNRSQRMNMANKMVKLAEMRIWETRRELLPDVAFKYEISTGKITADGYNRHYRGNKYGFELKHTVFDGFSQFYETRQSQVNYEINLQERQKISNEVISDTKTAYYSLDKTRKALDIQDKLKNKVNEYHSIVERAYQQEVVSREEYLKVRGQNLQTDFQHTSAVEDLELAELILFQAMNLEPEDSIEIVPVERPKEYVQIGLENCYEVALANNPEFRIKEKYIDYYNFERKMVKAKGLPKIDFDGNFGAAIERYEPMFLPADYQSDKAGNPIRAHRGLESEWYAGVKGTLPIWGNTLEYNYVREKWAPTVSAFRGSETATSYFTFNLLDNLSHYSNLQEAKVGYERSKYEYLKAKKDLLVEVKENYFKYRKALLQVDVANSQYEHQKMLLDILEERRRFGEMEMSRIIEEYIKFSEYEFGLIAGDFDYFISLVNLNASLGIPNYFRSFQEDRQLEKFEHEFIGHIKRTPFAGGEVPEGKRISSRDRKKAESYLSKARGYLERNDKTRAIRYIQQALAVDPTNEEAREYLEYLEE
ncbi:MAG: hypothetical protein GF408_04705, partial [Candidatus Omnitrophica bacterium]|nr:hypothetical protein [Candidatus Omnitrophota bacterium]